jgi:hypothetical protein
MLIGIVPYFLLLFGGTPVESFYIIDFGKGIKQHVVSITSRQDAEAIVSAYATIYKEFNNEHKKQIKELQQKNMDYNTSEHWYLDFFATAMEDRKKLQSSFITGRLRLQEIITQEEWDKIIEMITRDLEKMMEKKKKKREKNVGKSKYQIVLNTLKENIPPGEKLTLSLESLEAFKEKHIEIKESYENLYTSEEDILANRQATKEDMLEICNVLNKLRKSLIDSYIDLLFDLKDNTNEKEWTIIIKDLNKV